MKPQKRITKKYRMMSVITEAIENVVISMSDCCPSISSLSNTITDDSLKPNASSSIRTLVLDEVTNDVTRYFQEACKIVSSENEHLPFHFVTSKFYGKNYRTPLTKEEAREYVAMLGSGKIVGVRYLIDQEQTQKDKMYAVYVERLASNSENLNKAAAERFIIGIDTGAIDVSKVEKLPDAVKSIVKSRLN